MVEHDGFEIIDGPLPHRPSTTASTATATAASTAPTVVDEANPEAATVDLRRLPEKNALLVSVNPPPKPQNDIPHVPCDIVLVIDVSGSMSAAAPLPLEDESAQAEKSGLSVLDLTKHAARTIIETLNESDRLGVVTFSSEARIVYELSKMTKGNKEAARQEIEELSPGGTTNLWHGLKTGLRLVADTDPAPYNIPALFVLTDGAPNCMNPAQGYVPKLGPILREQRRTTSKLPLINTFGFGYRIRSGLLESISEIGGGNYGFIPEAGMLGTVLIHAIANLYTTYATQAKLTLRHPESMSLSVIDSFTTGIQLDETPLSPSEFSVNLGSLHYGQSREILLRYDTKTPEACEIETTLSCARLGQPEESTKETAKLAESAPLPSSVYQYHRSRAKICRFLRSLRSSNPEEEYVPLQHELDPLEGVIDYLKNAGHTDEQNASLFQDLAGEKPHGQVRLALSSWAYYDRWGKHYLLSLLNAHTHQICNSFKDPGPLQYGKNSPFFCRCRQELDDCFDSLPPPIESSQPPSDGYPAAAPRGGHGYGLTNFPMSRYRRASDPCFAGHCTVRLADNTRDDFAVRDVRAGMKLWTPCGPRTIRAVVATPVRDAVLCRLGSLDITPWHPVMADGIWAFPCQAPHKSVLFSGTVYSVLLENSTSSDAHAISVGGVLCVTLGHGVTAGCDARAHAFFGSYSRVARSLGKLPRDARGVHRARGVKRHLQTALACSFVGPGQVKRRVGKATTLGSRKKRASNLSTHRGRARLTPA